MVSAALWLPGCDVIVSYNHRMRMPVAVKADRYENSYEVALVGYTTQYIIMYWKAHPSVPQGRGEYQGALRIAAMKKPSVAWVKGVSSSASPPVPADCGGAVPIAFVHCSR